VKCHNQPSPYLKMEEAFGISSERRLIRFLYDSSVIGCYCRRLELK